MPSRKQLQLRRLLDLLPPYRYARAVNMGSKLALKIADYYFDNSQQYPMPVPYAAPINIPGGYGPGWRLECDTGFRPINTESGYRSSQSSTACGLGGQVISNVASNDNLIFRGYRASPTSSRHTHVQVWFHPLPYSPPVRATWTEPEFKPRPLWPEIPHPQVPQWLRPELLPPLAPMPQPAFPPFRVIPFLPGLSHRDAGNGESASFTPNMPPYRVPAADPGGRTDPPFTSPGHNYVPPGRGVKEKKRPGKYPPGVDEAIGVAGEFIDYVEAAHEALPERYQKGETPQEKLRDIYKHVDKMSWPKFIYNLGLNQAEDKAWGKVGSALGKASANKGGPTGLQTGPWDTSGGYYAGFY